MKILYAIQGTGNGHLSRARDIIPILQLKGDLDILISGIQADVDLPFPVKYRYRGLSFIFGKKGGVDVLATFRKSNLKQLYREIRSLPVEQYDLVISDFEPVSSWACKIRHKECIGLSHQAAVINRGSPKPESKDRIGKAILETYAPVSHAYGFHFAAYDHTIATPVIRSQIRNAVPQDKGHFSVYLPAYDDRRIIKTLSQMDCKWEVFSKHSKKEYRADNVHIRPVNNDDFIDSLINCSGILCGAGFETPAEALFLGKKLMVIPMKGQYEQQCNAAALQLMDVPVIRSLKDKHIEKIWAWTRSEHVIRMEYPDMTENILNELLVKHGGSMPVEHLPAADFSVKKLSELTKGNILKKGAV